MITKAIGVEEVFVCFPTLTGCWQRDILALDQFIHSDQTLHDMSFIPLFFFHVLDRLQHSPAIKQLMLCRSPLSSQSFWVKSRLLQTRKLQKKVIQGMEQYGICGYTDWLGRIQMCAETWRNLYPTMKPLPEPKSFISHVFKRTLQPRWCTSQYIAMFLLWVTVWWDVTQK